MLVLSRKVGETVLIGRDVSVTVVRIGPNSIRLGITAPKSDHIVRGELLTQAVEIDVELPIDGVAVNGPLDLLKA